MPKSFVVDLKINVTGNYSRQLKQVTQQTAKATTKMQKLKAAASGMRAQFSKGLVGGALLLGAGKVAENWQNGMNKIATMTKLTGKEVEAKWGDDIKKIALKTGQSLGDVTESFYGALSRQVKQSDVVKVTEVIAKGATAGFGSMTDTMKGAIAMSKTFGITVEAAINKMLIAQEEGATDLGQLSQVMGNLGATFGSIDSSSKMSDEILASVSAMTILGSTTGEASTSLNAFFSSALNKTSKAAKLMKKMNINFTGGTIAKKGISGSVKYLFDQINKLSKADKDQSLSMISTFFRRKEAFKAFSQLASKTGQEVSKKALKRMAKDTTALDRNFKKMGGNKAFAKLKTQLQIIAITVGQVLMPALLPIFTFIGDIAKAVQGWVKENKTLAKVLGYIAVTIAGLLLSIGLIGGAIGLVTSIVATATVVWGALATAGTALAGVMAVVASPIVLIIAVVAALVVGFGYLVYKFGSVSKAAKVAAKAIAAPFVWVGKKVNGIIDGIFGKSLEMTNQFKNVLLTAKNKALVEAGHEPIPLAKEDPISESGLPAGLKAVASSQKTTNNNKINITVNAKTNASAAQIGKQTAAQAKKTFNNMVQNAKNSKQRLAGVPQ
jgi:TP901 family phage tail tape measure protein